ncbi:hypothetical protein GCK72_018104 [Caenorhabditis remanei]|uniref:Phospholipid/glycerol acyltransferase domain-containing protein n=1 Tax=Caenorhabditis remanei TaxID=31234 RepID=A0A6A5G973_CAERE|nr:hypothetical protein GCK72_018104 [Caenorhabditis remanei]KAF1751550.1 hypothetical protein GCK72_018104 [Caenorhabditis remanei]
MRIPCILRPLLGWFFGLAILFSALFGNYIITLFLGLPIFGKHRAWRNLMDRAISYWMTIPMGLLEFVMGVRVRVSGDEIEFGSPALIVMNHRTRLDWMYMWCALYQVNPWLITSNKISLKAQLKKLPGAGFGMAAAQFVFLERNAEVDKKSFDDAIDYFKNIGKDYQILLFPEGTDKSEWTTLKSREFAKKNGLRHLEYVLYPRTTGFLHLLNKMRQQEYVDYIYDITIAYPYNIVQSEVDLVIKGSSPREVHFHIRKIPISQVPLNETDASKWLTERWAVKEQLLHQFYSEEQPINRQFPVERGDGVWRSWKEPRRHFYVKVTALCFWCLVIAFCSYHIFFVRTLQLGFLYFFIVSMFLNWRYGGIDKYIIGKWQQSNEALLRRSASLSSL